MRYFLGVVLLSLIAGNAVGSMLFDPPRPTDHTLVTLRIDEPWEQCLPGPVQSVTRDGDGIAIGFYAYGGCDCTFVWRTSVVLGALPSGTHRVRVFVGERAVFTGQLTVSEELPELIVTPSILNSRESTPVVITTRNDTLCNDLGVPTVLVNGATLPATRTLCTVRTTMPPHPAGPVDIVVKTEDSKFQSRGTVRYYDETAAPDPWLHERMLVPLLVDQKGAQGSTWKSVASLTNASGRELLWRHEVARPLSGATSVPAYTNVSLWSYGEHPSGLVLFVPRELSSSVYFGNTVEDASHPVQWGVEVPVVRESESYTGIMRIVNVPFEDRYRLQLRVYGIDGASVPFIVRAIDSTTLVQNPLVLSAPCTESELPCNSELPAYASVDLHTMFPWVRGTRLLRLEPAGATTPLHYWAMVSVTDNVTGAVTLLTPQ